MNDLTSCPREFGTRVVSTDSGPWEPLPDPAPEPVEKATYVPTAWPDWILRGETILKLVRPRPIPDPFGGGLEDLRGVLGEQFDVRIGELIEKSTPGRWNSPADARARLERRIALENALERREPDEARDGLELATLVVRGHFERGGSLAELLRRSDAERRQVLNRCEELSNSTKTIEIEPNLPAVGLADKIREGSLGILEGAAKLRAVEAEIALLLPIYMTMKELPDKIAAEKGGRCRELVERFGADRLAQAHRESLGKRRLFRADDPERDRLKGDLDAAAAEYGALKSPVSVDPGPLELEAHAKLREAGRIFDEYTVAADEFRLAEIKAPIEAASAGYPEELIGSAQAVPAAYPEGFLESFAEVDLEVALAVDPVMLSMLVW